MFGGLGDDWLYGGSGEDRLNAGQGVDGIVTGTENDVVFFDVQTSGLDVITDGSFGPGDGDKIAILNGGEVNDFESGVTFKWKDYRIEGPGRYKTMTLPTHEFIRRFLMHVLPKGVHRIRHYGLFANGNGAANIALARELLAVPTRVTESKPDAPAETDQLHMLPTPCPCCGGRMIIIETFTRGCEPKHGPITSPPNRIDTS